MASTVRNYLIVSREARIHGSRQAQVVSLIRAAEVFTALLERSFFLFIGIYLIRIPKLKFVTFLEIRDFEKNVSCVESFYFVLKILPCSKRQN